jgi:DNA-binding beta-propeller fold protein YncE
VIHPTAVRATAPQAPGSNPTPMLRATAFVALLVVAGCTASANDVIPPNGEAGALSGDNPPKDISAQFFWPTGMAISPDESMLFVANANSDLQFNSGTVDVIDVNAVESAVQAWLAPAHTLGERCRRDTDFTETMVCDQEAAYMNRDAAIRIGNFATAIGIQDKGGADLRLIIPVRGDPSITWADWSGAGKRLSCADGDGTYQLCDDAHRLTRMRNDSALPALFDEPFDVFVDSANQYAMVTHLSSGSVTLVDSPKAGAPILADSVGGLFNPDAIGSLGASAIAGRDPGSPDDIVYVASRTEDRIETFGVVRPRASPLPILDPSSFFFLDAVGTQAGGSNDSRGMAFGSGGNRLYLINREPPTLQVYDTSIGPTGTPRNVGLGATDICREASRLIVTDSGDGDRIYIACFGVGQIYVVDPRAGVQVEDVITVGNGPYDVVASASKRRLYVTNYLENTLAVIDITPGSTTRNRVVMRLGEPKAP